MRGFETFAFNLKPWYLLLPVAPFGVFLKSGSGSFWDTGRYAVILPVGLLFSFLIYPVVFGIVYFLLRKAGNTVTSTLKRIDVSGSRKALLEKQNTPKGVHSAFIKAMLQRDETIGMVFATSLGVAVLLLVIMSYFDYRANNDANVVRLILLSVISLIAGVSSLVSLGFYTKNPKAAGMFNVVPFAVSGNISKIYIKGMIQKILLLLGLPLTLILLLFDFNNKALIMTSVAIAAIIYPSLAFFPIRNEVLFSRSFEDRRKEKIGIMLLPIVASVIHWFFIQRLF